MVCALGEAVLSGQEGAMAAHWRSSAPRKKVRGSHFGSFSVIPMPSLIPELTSQDLQQ